MMDSYVETGSAPMPSPSLTIALSITFNGPLFFMFNREATQRSRSTRPTAHTTKRGYSTQMGLFQKRTSGNVRNPL